MSERTGKLFDRHPEVEIWAAGGVVHRDGDDGVEVLLVHRPDHADWSLPKGKLDDGETLKQAALREVEEETGLVCEAGKRLEVVRYVDARGREKGVAYWLMTATSGSFVPNKEVDAVAWLGLREAGERCTYAHDAALLGKPVRRHLAE